MYLCNSNGCLACITMHAKKGYRNFYYNFIRKVSYKLVQWTKLNELKIIHIVRSDEPRPNDQLL